MGTNIGEVLTVFFAMILWKKTPLLSMHLLWINLVTDSMPAIALGMEAVEEDVMNHRQNQKTKVYSPMVMELEFYCKAVCLQY